MYALTMRLGLRLGCADTLKFNVKRIFGMTSCLLQEVIQTEVLVHGVDGFHIFLGELKIEHINVLGHVLYAH